MNKDNL